MEAKSAIILTAFVFAILTAVLEIMSVLMQNDSNRGFRFHRHIAARRGLSAW